MNYNETHSSVGIFMDAENVIKAFRETTDGIDGAYIDFGEMRNLLAGDRDIRCSKAYGIYFPDTGVSSGLRHIEGAGFDLELERFNGYCQKGVDMSMGLDAVECAMTNDCDTILLVSGDGDFVPAARKAKNLGKRVQVAAFESVLSEDLAEIADEVILLDQLRMVDTRCIRKRAAFAL